MAQFTEEEQRLLRLNQHVTHVSEFQVSFTPEFKRMAARQKKEGKSVRLIFQENGIDPAILGQRRLYNFSYMLIKANRLGSDFADKRIEKPASKLSAVEELSLKEQLQWMIHKLEYTEQEVEFLKKLQMANTEARKQWELKHRQR